MINVPNSKPITLRLQAQFDHLAETYFSGFDHDLGERELGYALSFDNDLDVFAASIGLTKTSVATILHDEGEIIFSRFILHQANE